MQKGVTIALYSESGGGKTTQIGEYAKDVWKRLRKRTRLVSSDLGGYGSIDYLADAGILDPVILTPDDDPWIFLNDEVEGKNCDDSIGCVAYDSGTSKGEWLLKAARTSDFKVGQQNTQRFTVSKGATNLTVGTNNEAHYGVVQGFLLDQMWRSTYLTNREIDVIWTFAVHRGEGQDQSPILGPKLAGKALTPSIPKWFNYTFMLESIPVAGEPARHVLYTQEQPDRVSGLSHSFGNLRFPLGVEPPPAVIEPASLPEVMRLIREAKEAAKVQLEMEMS